MADAVSREQVLNQYPPPPPVATGPGLDRPMFVVSPEYPVGNQLGHESGGNGGYTMMRTQRFYADHFDNPEPYTKMYSPNSAARRYCTSKKELVYTWTHFFFNFNSDLRAWTRF